MINFTRRGLLTAGAVALIGLAAGCSGGDKPAEKGTGETASLVETGPAYALITQPVGKPAPDDFAAQLAAARNGGQVSDVILLKAKPSVEGPLGFDSLAVVEFTSDAAYEKWETEAAPKLGKDLIVRRADLLVDDRAKEHGAAPAYVVSHYEALIPKDEYTAYTKAYIKPNMDGQKAGGVMAGYAMFYEREPVPGIKGNRTILVKEYVDEAAFGKSEAIKEKDKVRLLKDPEWKKINDTKTTLRNDISGTLALPVKLP